MFICIDIPRLALCLWALYAADFDTEIVVQLAEVELLELLVALGGVDCHIIETEMELAEIEKRVIDVLRRDELLDEIIRNWL